MNRAAAPGLLDDERARSARSSHSGSRPPGRRGDGPPRRCSSSRCSGRCCPGAPSGPRPRSASGLSREQRRRAHQHPGRAVAALEPVARAERLLQRRQLAVPRRAPRRSRSRRRRPARRAACSSSRAAPSTITEHAPQLPVSQPMWRAGQVEVVAEEVDEQPAGLDLALVALAVHVHADSGAADGSIAQPYRAPGLLDGTDGAAPRRGAGGSRPTRGRRTADRARPRARPPRTLSSSVPCRSERARARRRRSRSRRAASPSSVAAALTMQVPSRPSVTAAKPSPAARAGSEIASAARPAPTAVR